MKIKFLSVTFILILILSCEKTEFRKDISGSWELKGAGGGLSPHEIETNYTLLKIRNNFGYSIINFDTLKAKGTYLCRTADHHYYEGLESFHLWFDSFADYRTIRNFPFRRDLDVRFLSNDTLILSEQCCDGYEYFFVRSGN